VLATELAQLSRVSAEAFNLEARLRQYAEHDDPRIRGFFKEVPPYLRDLINGVVNHHTFWWRRELRFEAPNPTSHALLVMRLLTRGFRVGFIVLNYDDYLELALEQFDPALAIKTLDDYVASGRQALVFKVHGSVDWGQPMGPDDGRWSHHLAAFELPTRPERMVLNRSRKATKMWSTESDRGRSEYLYPVLTAPLAGKGQADLVCPASHLEALGAFLKDCRHYIVIGTSGLDGDVLAFLAECSKDIESVHYVSDNATNADIVAGRFNDACGKFGGANRTAYGEGFANYLTSPEFGGFLASI
jgi:hypothetical protein